MVKKTTKTTRGTKVKSSAVTKAATKTATKTSAVKFKAIRETPWTKSEIVTAIAEQSGLTRNQIKSVFDTQRAIIKAHIAKGAVGKFKFDGLMNIEVRKRPATKARKGTNPFTGEPTVFKAKPASRVVKVKALKALKEMTD